MAIDKPGKKEKRPLIVFDVEARIVQRAVLEIVKALHPIAQTLRSGFNFGGIEGEEFGNRAAIVAAANSFNHFGYFIRSDIRAFFGSVPREIALSALVKQINDESFVRLIRDATSVEIANRQALGPDLKFFPSDDFGLAQGSCLSPLLCNLVLDEFDRRMNALGCRCIRFIDDFVIFSRDRRHARAAFSVGIAELRRLNLDAYDPLASDKAEEGATHATPLKFLGCEIRKHTIRPSLQNRRVLLRKIDAQLANSHASITDALADASRTLVGWGNNFGFCTDDKCFNELDQEIMRRGERFLRSRLSRMRHKDTTAWLQQLGFQPLLLRKRPRTANGQPCDQDRVPQRASLAKPPNRPSPHQRSFGF